MRTFVLTGFRFVQRIPGGLLEDLLLESPAPQISAIGTRKYREEEEEAEVEEEPSNLSEDESDEK